MATEIILIRHGFALRVHGDYVHAPLTSLGEHQADLTGRFLSQSHQKLSALYCSPLLRARQTAAAITAHTSLPAHERSGLQEIRYPELPGLCALEILSVLDPVEDYLDDHAGRSLNWPVEGRVAKVILEILSLHPGARVGVVAHSGVISSSLAWLFPDSRWHWWRHLMGNCSLTTLRFEGNCKLLSADNSDHLHPEVRSAQSPSRPAQISKQVPLPRSSSAKLSSPPTSP